MNPNQLHILQHALGCDQYGRSTAISPRCDEGDGCFGYYRNRYVSDPDDDLRQLVLVGVMKDHGPQSIAGGTHCFTVTRAGVNEMITSSQKPPKLSRAKRRYQRWLSVADCFENFRAFLKYESAREKKGAQ